jgi:hypothetical protein
MTRLQIAVVVVAVVTLLAGPRADEQASSKLAGQLAALLDERKLDAFAVESPDMPGRFAAMLYIPESQILAISAPSAYAEYFRTAIAAGKHRQVYMDISGAANRDARLFVQDLQANGLQPARKNQEPFDITWRDGTSRVAYDGEWGVQKLSADEYRDRFARDEREYAEMLRWFIHGLSENRPSSSVER